MKNKPTKVVLTGAPSSGKSSVIAALTTLGMDVVAIPEVASVLLAGGYPAPLVGDVDQQRLFQIAILELQKNLEAIFELKNPDARLVVLDRATLDGVGYWPMGPEDFFKEFNVSIDAELARYDYVLCFETPPKNFFGGMGVRRFHDYKQSVDIGQKQKDIWSRHPGFIWIPNADNFDDKLDCALNALRKMV